MTGPSWFASNVPVRHTIHYPGAAERGAAMRRAGSTAEEVAEFMQLHSFWVEVRELSSGDRATLEEMRFTAEGSGVLDYGSARLMTVQLCLTAWSLPEALTREAVRQLKPLVLDAILAVIDEGKLTADDVIDGANGTGPVSDEQLAMLAAETKDAAPGG